MSIEIKMPPPAEGLETVTVTDVKVRPGDVVRAGQALLEVEAEKSTVEVPSPAAGRIGKVLVKKNDTVQVGQTLFVLEDGVAEPAAAKEPETAEKPRPAPEPAAPRGEDGRRRPAAAPPPKAEPAPAKAATIPLAGPATRQLARELGVDLSQVAGTGRGGRVTEEDVKGYVRQLASVPVTAAGPAAAAPKLPDFEKWGPVEREALGQVRRLTAQHVSVAWGVIPHVTQHDVADVTELEAFRKQQQGNGPKLTVTAFALKAAAVALKQFPQFNASLDAAAGQVILKRYYHIGVAVDTERGLLVPVIRDVDKKSVAELAAELAEAAERARRGKADMQGGTFTITNLGGIGGTGFTPIVNWPEVAILGLSRSRPEPVVRDGQVVPRLMLPLSLSYDHRVIDGAAAARFTRRLAEMLENPLVMLLHA
jgi:pyruvate dehydrogenase E2 component (dihydrolipoamide acetyltransferase)